jgi:short chain dehydrogenase
MKIALRLFLACSLFIVVTGLSAAQPNGAGFAKASPVVLITGSNRGIGLALTKAYAAAGWRVIATCRDPSRASELKGLAQVIPT